MTQNKRLHVRHRAVLDAVAGASAGCVARFVVGPLDVLKIRFQVQLEPIQRVSGGVAGQLRPKYTGLVQAFRTIVREEGVLALWRGTLAGQLLYIPYTTVQFVTLQQVKAAGRRHGIMGGKMAPLMSYASGAVAGFAATAVSYPFDLLRTTLAAQGEPRVYRGMISAARGIVAQHGPLGLYNGLGITLLEIVPYAALQFGLYDSFNTAYDIARRKRHLALGGEEGQLPPAGGLQQFLCGLGAGTLAKLGTHPLDVCKKRFQVAGLQRAPAYGAPVTRKLVRSLAFCLRDIWAREGARGLYKGSLPSVMKAAPAAAATFTAYELLMRILLERVDVDQREQ